MAPSTKCADACCNGMDDVHQPSVSSHGGETMSAIKVTCNLVSHKGNIAGEMVAA